MGICYYLVREDDRTIYELGKGTGDWGEALGMGTEWDGCTGPEVTMGMDRAEWLTTELERLSDDLGPVPPGYYADVATDILRWAEGRPFRFIIENGILEQWTEDPDYDFDSHVTGSRYHVDPGIAGLLGEATDIASRYAVGRSASRMNLERMSRHANEIAASQIDAGRWAAWVTPEQWKQWSTQHARSGAPYLPQCDFETSPRKTPDGRSRIVARWTFVIPNEEDKRLESWNAPQAMIVIDGWLTMPTDAASAPADIATRDADAEGAP